MADNRRCWKCRKPAEIKSMRYDASGRDLICPECLSAENRTVAKEAAKKAAEKEKKTDEESRTISYQCGSCGFGFSEEKGARVRCCPYCGKGNFRIAFKDSAQSIIEESAKEKFEY